MTRLLYIGFALYFTTAALADSFYLKSDNSTYGPFTFTDNATITIAGVSYRVVSAEAPSMTHTNTLLPASTPPTMTAAALSGAYEKNQVAADSRYNGNPIIVEGVIEKIEQSWYGLTIDLEDNVFCAFPDSEKDSVLTLSKGDLVRIRGVVTGKGYRRMGICVEIDKCTVEK